MLIVFNFTPSRSFFYSSGREPMAREPVVALLITACGSLDIFFTRLLRMKVFL